MSAQHARDRAFADYATLPEGDDAPPEALRRAEAVRRRAEDALGAAEQARARYREWLRTQGAAGAEVDALRERAERLLSSIGDPDALVNELSGRYDESEWRPAADAADAAVREIRTALDRLDAADAVRDDPSRTAFPTSPRLSVRCARRKTARGRSRRSTGS